MRIKHVPNGFEGMLLQAALKEDVSQILLVVQDRESVDSIIEEIKFFNPNIKIAPFKAWDTMPYDRLSPNPSVLSSRVKTLVQLCSEKEIPQVVVASVSALIQKVPPKKALNDSSILIQVGDELNREFLHEILVDAGFSRMINAIYPGEFAARGGIIDVVLDDSGCGYRVDFFGDMVEKIRLYDAETQMSGAVVKEVMICPASELLINNQTISCFAESYQKQFGFLGDPLIDAISEGRKYAGCENWLPLFYRNMEHIFDYLRPNVRVFLPQDFDNQVNIKFDEINNTYQNRLNTSKSDYHPLDPKFLYDKAPLIKNTIFYDRAKDELIKNVTNYVSAAKVEQKNSLDFLKEDIISKHDAKFMVCCFSQGSLERLKNMMKDHGIATQQVENYDEFLKLKKGFCALAICPQESGFIYNKQYIISERDLFEERFTANKKVKKLRGEIFNELSGLAEGELVVHSEHGIGRFEGLEAIEVNKVVRDFAKIIYAGDDKFYLPVENLELISRYGSGEVALDKLGSVGWQTRKAKLKNRIKLAAEQLLKVAALRELRQGEVIVPINELFEEFCSKFPYVETDDQLKAVEDILDDFARGKPMDRLVCGDVGFGKTEVALRAAFLAVASEKRMQVAVLVPTTLLSRQHYQTFCNRFKDFPIKIKQLSKFTSIRDAKLIKQEIAEGTVEIVIGTHALLAKTIKFANLGMIIIDEEQHFGVAQKERLKELKSNCHILTLSATPIPRTLQMSLAGIRDLSLITTPPVDRHPIKTYVIPTDKLILKEAILREIYRGGRVFYVTPRVAYLDSLMSDLQNLLPEIKMVMAHGQMGAAQLDEIMNDFYDGKYQVLISTTIVESGLDAPNANTIIVDRAHLFGLSQLYQIRGRVGRGNAQAYAYLTYPPGLKLNQTAQKRLEILQSMDYLGAGFAIASHDMDLRGYGNIMGDEQSGHIKEVGVELYQQMLNEAVNNIKLSEVEEQEDNAWSPALNIGISIQIPDEYIPDVALRLSLYRKIANLDSENDLETLAAEIIDRFGSLPAQAEYLFAIVKLKQLAKKANIEKLDIGEKGALIAFRNKQPANVENVMNLVARNPLKIKLRPDNKIFVEKSWTSDAEVILQYMMQLVAALIKS